MFTAWQNHLATLNIDDKPQTLLPQVICPLTQYRFIRITGPDAGKFLQGQLSCDIQQLTSSTSGLGSHNNAKGRMLSSFRICLLGEGDYLLRVHRSIAETARSALAKYIVFSKANIDLPDDYIALGLHGEQAQQNLQKHFPDITDQQYRQSLCDSMVLICTSARFKAFELYGKVDKVLALWPDISQQLTVTDCKQQQLIEHHEGLAFVEQETAQSLIPQMFNYQALPAISFQKGCYTGQEIVARMQYLGKLKRHLLHCTANTDKTVNTGDELFLDRQQQSVGIVAACTAVSDHQVDLLLVLTHEASSADRLYSHEATLSSLKQLPLPYSLEKKAKA